ncbi:MAG: sigma-70 family RNA polymerase sigma factor [Microscillaceae bacterium]
MKDSLILKKIKEGDERALDIVYKKNYKMMVRLIIKNNGTEDEAKDIYQEAIVVFWQKARQPEFVLTSKISTFLYSVCLNLWRKELERKARLSSEMKDGETISNYDQLEKEKVVQECINSLGETCRQVLMYYYFDNYSMQEIADKMGFANADTAKSKKYKCKKELDNLIKSKYKATDFLD